MNDDPYESPQSTQTTARPSASGRNLTIAAWGLMIGAIAVSAGFYFTTDEAGPEQRLGTVMAYGLFGGPSLLLALIQFIQGISTFFRQKDRWNYWDILNPMAIAGIPFSLAILMEIVG